MLSHKIGLLDDIIISKTGRKLTVVKLPNLEIIDEINSHLDKKILTFRIMGERIIVRTDEFLCSYNS